jgi:tripeptidyl-peptidase I
MFGIAAHLNQSFTSVAAARGSTLLVASGDHGVGDGISEPEFTQCFTNDGSNQLRFIPTFPASCGYVTSVGATQNVPEAAASYSGGGFSNYVSISVPFFLKCQTSSQFVRPQFQDEAVRAFLRKLPNGTYDGLYNR